MPIAIFSTTLLYIVGPAVLLALLFFNLTFIALGSSYVPTEELLDKEEENKGSSRTRYMRSGGISPHIYAVTTKADIRTIADDAKVMKGLTDWHLGYGADLQVGYQLTSCLKLGIYSGLTRLTGERMDAMPEHLHKNNFVWESGIRLGISFAKTKKKNIAVETMPTTEPEVPQQVTTPQTDLLQKETADKAETKVAEQGVAEQHKVTFPVVYFAFNSIAINQSELSKLNDILRTLKENPDMKVTVTGWCDTKGSVAVNKRISRQRAEALKTWLVRKGIEASRITAVGNGSDGSLEAGKARRVETTDNNK